MENIVSLKRKWFKKEVERLINEGVSKADIARALDIKPQYLNSVLHGSRGLADTFLDKFIEAYGINQFDLLPRSDDSTVSTVSLRFMDKLDEKDYVIKEKENKIELLQSELRQQSVELATLKAKYLELQDKELAHPSVTDTVTEAFTIESFGDYGEDSIPTKLPSTSKRSSAGKV